MNQDIRPLVRAFQIHNQAENKSEKTIAWYDASIARFCRFVEEETGSTPTLDDFNIDQVQLFIVELQSKPSAITSPFAPVRIQYLSPTTINSYVRGLRAFTHWLYLFDRTPTWTLERLKPP